MKQTIIKATLPIKNLLPPAISLVLRSRIRNIVPESTVIWRFSIIFSSRRNSFSCFWCQFLTITYYQDAKRSIFCFDANFLPNNPENEEKQNIFWRVHMDLNKKLLLLTARVVSFTSLYHEVPTVHVSCCFHTSVKKKDLSAASKRVLEKRHVLFLFYFIYF